jgi:hypothetical protein
LKRQDEKTLIGLIWLRIGFIVSTIMNFGVP